MAETQSGSHPNTTWLVAWPATSPYVSIYLALPGSPGRASARGPGPGDMLSLPLERSQIAGELLPPATGERDGYEGIELNRDVLMAKMCADVAKSLVHGHRLLIRKRIGSTDPPRALRGSGDVRFRVVDPEEGFVAPGHGQSGATERFDAYR